MATNPAVPSPLPIPTPDTASRRSAVPDARTRADREAADDGRMRLGWRWWLLAFGWWTADGLASATFVRQMRDHAGVQPAWADVLTTFLASAWLWVPVTLLALWLSGRFPLERGRWARNLPVHVAAAAFVIVARAALVVVLNPWIPWYPRGLPAWPELLHTSVQNNLFLYGMVTGVAQGIHFAHRYRRRERQLAQAQLAALKAQIQPHFLFNTLNTIAAFVHSDPRTAERMVTRLSDLLRHTLAAARQEVPLQEELDFLEPYLEIEQARFEDRLRVRWEVEPAAREAVVPHLILQPLVENALKHGLSRRSAPGTLEVAARRVDGTLRMTVRDDGVGLPDDFAWKDATGVGLANVRARLAQIHGARHRFELRPAEGGGTEALIEIPYRRFGLDAAAGHDEAEGEG